MKKKILTICLVAALAAMALVGATLAYFTDSAEAENVINIGKVDIDLTEPDYVDGQTLMPGTVISKKPTITVAKDSQDAYLFVEIDWNRYQAFIDTAINAGVIEKAEDLVDHKKREAFLDFFVEGLDHSKWEIMNADEILQIKEGQEFMPVILGYKGKEAVSAEDEIVVFTGIKLDKDLTQKDMALFYEVANDTTNGAKNDVNINIKAIAVQKANVANLAAAYEIAFPSIT